jgi:hypothetical protein
MSSSLTIGQCSEHCTCTFCLQDEKALIEEGKAVRRADAMVALTPSADPRAIADQKAAISEDFKRLGGPVRRRNTYSS